MSFLNTCLRLEQLRIYPQLVDEMNDIIREATRLLNEYKPKEALLRLSDLNEESVQSLQLKESCKRLYKQQALYLLKEESDNNKVKGIVDEYRRLIGDDKEIQAYIEIANEISEERKKENFVLSIVFLLIGIAIILILYVYITN